MRRPATPRSDEPPPRWRDDAEFVRATGIDLSLLDAEPPRLDLARGLERLRRVEPSGGGGPGTGGGSAPSTASGAGAGHLVAMAILSLGSALGLAPGDRSGGVEPPPHAAPASPREALTPLAPATHARLTSPSSPKVRGPIATAERHPRCEPEAVVAAPRRVATPSSAGGPGAHPKPVAARPMRPVRTAEPEEASSTLAAELASYERAQALERRGDLAAAHAAFAAHLARFPDGALAAEVRIGLARTAR